MPSGFAPPSAAGPIFPASAVTVSIAGVPEPKAHVTSVIWHAGSQANRAEIEFPRDRFHEMRRYAVGATVDVFMSLAGAPSILLFTGKMTSRVGEYEPSGESFSVVALGPRWDLNKDYVAGQEMIGVLLLVDPETGKAATVPPTFVKADLASLPEFCFHALPCVFNYNGKGNKSGRKSGAIAVFHEDPRVVPVPGETTGKFEWNAAEMLSYCYRQRIRSKRREFRPSFGAPPVTNVVGHPIAGAGIAGPLALGATVLTEFVIYDMNVDGKPIAEAFHSIFTTAGMLWWLKPSIAGGASEGELKFHFRAYVPDDASLPSVSKTLFMPDVSPGVLPEATISNPRLPGARPDHIQGRLQEDFSNVLGGVSVFGSPIRAQFEVELRPGWNKVDELFSYDNDFLPLSAQERQRAMLNKTTESLAGDAWNPARDPTSPIGALKSPYEPFTRDVGRLFILDELGYATDRAGDVVTVGEDFGDRAKLAFPRVGFNAYPAALTSPIAVRPRPFLRDLVNKVVLKGNSEIGGHAPVVQLFLQHPNAIESETAFDPLIGTEAPRPTFVAVDQNNWALEPDQGGVRITRATLDGQPYSDIGGWTPGGAATGIQNVYAERARLRVSVEGDWLLGAGKDEPTAVVPTRRRMMADREMEAYLEGATSGPVIAAIVSMIERRLLLNAGPVRAATFTFPTLITTIEIGHWITDIVGRSLAWIGQVVEVRFDVQNQQTHITLEDPMIFLGANV